MCDDAESSDENDETASRISGGEFTSASLSADAQLGGLEVQQAQMVHAQAQAQAQQQGGLFQGAAGKQFGAPAPQAAPAAAEIANDAALGATEASRLASILVTLASDFQSGLAERHRPRGMVDESNYWNDPHRYASVLRFLANLLRRPEAQNVQHGIIGPVDETELFLSGRPEFRSTIKHPVCFRDIVHSLTAPREEGAYGSGRASNTRNGGRGKLPLPNLKRWNMWDGRDLLHAIDLVVLNWLAYVGKERQEERYPLLKLRKSLWDFISEAADYCREVMPTKRGEASGFVRLK